MVDCHERTFDCRIAQALVALMSQPHGTLVAGTPREERLFDLGQISVNGLIVHEVPKHFVHSDVAATPTLSEVESSVDQTVKNFFRERMANTLGRSAYEVECDPDSTSPIPALLDQLLTKKPTVFLTASQEMARHLHTSQPGISPEGLLTVIRCTVEKRPAVAVMKLEKEEGTRVRRVKQGGQQTFNVNHIHDLMLTGKTRVFKVGLFARDGSSRAIQGLVCDKQKALTTTVAHFFLQTFLGCRLLETAEITTRRCWEVTERFINDEVSDPERKGRYQVALAAEMATTQSAVSMTGFVTNNLEVEDRAPLLERATEANVPTSSFPKDTKLILPQLKRLQWSFRSGISVLASSEQLGDQLNVEELDDGRTHLEVTDHLKDVHGHR